MVEKIIVNPNKIRGYGNIHETTSASEWSIHGGTLTKTTDTVDGATTDVFQLQPASYTLTFNSASYTTSTGSVDVEVTVNEHGFPISGKTVTVRGGGGTGTGTTNISGVANITVTGINQSGTLTAFCGFSTATATVTYQTTTYSLAFSQSTYTIEILDSVTVSCTLTNGGVAMSGETVTFSWESAGFPITVSATTNSNGVATYQMDYFDFTTFPTTVTATYSGVTATCTITDIESRWRSRV